MDELERAALTFDAMLNMKASGIRVGLTFNPLAEQRLIGVAALITMLRNVRALDSLDHYTLIHAYEKDFRKDFDDSVPGTKALVGTLEAIFHADEVAGALGLLKTAQAESRPLIRSLRVIRSS